MHLALTPEQLAFRDEVRDYFTGVMTPDVVAKVERDPVDIDAYKALMRRFGADGWLCPTWPVELGGRGLTPVEQFVFFDEVQRLRVPMPFLTTNTVGPTIAAYGSDEQKAHFLPRILQGDCLFAIGYSEPGAGTDLASLTTRAVRDGDDWVITGQKMWTSLIDRADYVWLACRTDADAPKHKGISIILVPTDADGFSWTRVDTIGGGLTSATYYQDVRVPVSSTVGEVNEGWRLMTSQLNQERIALSSSGVVQRRFEEVRRWAQQTKLADGRRVIDQDWVQRNLAEVRARLEAMRLMNWKVAWEASQDRIEPADASAMKVYGSEFYIDTWRKLMEVVGPRAALRPDDPAALFGGELEEEFRRSIILTFGGGTNEIQRDIIATMGLGLPRSPR
jgi:alkylation response protein AidB-like acyl-CoA dehydrogenase